MGSEKLPDFKILNTFYSDVHLVKDKTYAAKCNICILSKRQRFHKTSSANLRRHLKDKHPQQYTQYEIAENQKTNIFPIDPKSKIEKTAKNVSHDNPIIAHNIKETTLAPMLPVIQDKRFEKSMEAESSDS